MSRAIFNDMPTAYRAVHLTSGVSPMTSLLLMLGGFYWWFWQTLSGLALLGRGTADSPPPGKRFLRRSLASAAKWPGILKPSRCLFLAFASKGGCFYIFPFVIITLLVLALLRPFGGNFDSMLHSFENKSFNVTLHLMFAIAVYLLILECTQLLSTWLALKRLLLALNRTPLRRTFSALQGLSMHSLWSLSGTTSRARYTIFSHQLESLFHLRNVLDSFEARDVGNQEVRTRVEEACNRGQAFIVDRATSADLAMINTPAARRVRKQISQCAERILNDLLLPDWCEETGTLDLVEDGRQANSQGSAAAVGRHRHSPGRGIYLPDLCGLLAKPSCPHADDGSCRSRPLCGTRLFTGFLPLHATPGDRALLASVAIRHRIRGGPGLRRA